MKEMICKLLMTSVILVYVLSGGLNASGREGLAGKQGMVQIQVRDAKTGYGISAEILFENDANGLNLDFITDPHGKLNVTLDGENYSYRVSASSYKSIESYLANEVGKVLQIQVWLDPLNGASVMPTRTDNLQKDNRIAWMTGHVVDSTTYQPLRGVEVVSEKTGVSVMTDEKGLYILKLPLKETGAEGPLLTDTLTYWKKGYKLIVLKNAVLSVNDISTNLIDLEEGSGMMIRNDLHSLLSKDETRQLNVPTISGKHYKAQPIFSPDEFTRLAPGKSFLLSPPAEPNLLVWNPPATIRVGTTCSCTTCTSVDVISLETYVERGLNDEWYGSWVAHSLRSGAIPYRSYGTYYIYNPINANYDICSSTCCQAYDTDTSANAVAAADYTAGFLLQRNNSIFRSEYSAENNAYNCTDAGCSNSDCSCGDGNAGSPAASWPCISDSVCAGTTCYGHGRGMCQWGTQRWASAQSQLWKWIVNHYYNNNGSPGGYRTAYMTSPMDIASASPDPSTIPPGGTFTINVSGTNYAALTHAQIMIGASLYSASTGYINDSANDTKVILIPGNNNVSRPFTVPGTTPDGVYDLVVALWFDVDENNQITSTDLSLVSKTYIGAVTVSSCTTPGQVSNPSPPSGGTACASPTLSWTAGTGATSYDVNVDGGIICSNITTTSCSTTYISGSHNWYVVSRNTCGTTNGPSWNFLIDTTPPSPVGNTLKQSKSSPNVVLDWADISGAANYKVYRATNPSLPFPSGWTLLSQPISSIYSDPVLSNTTNYFYKTLSVDSCGNTE